MAHHELNFLEFIQSFRRGELLHALHRTPPGTSFQVEAVTIPLVAHTPLISFNLGKTADDHVYCEFWDGLLVEGTMRRVLEHLYDRMRDEALLAYTWRVLPEGALTVEARHWQRLAALPQGVQQRRRRSAEMMEGILSHTNMQEYINRIGLYSGEPVLPRGAFAPSWAWRQRRFGNGWL